MDEILSRTRRTALLESTFIQMTGFDRLCPETTAAQSRARGPKFVCHNFDLAS